MPEKVSQKGSVKISTFAGMTIIAAVVVVMSTIAVIKYREVSNITAPIAATTSSLTPSASPTPNPDETANWETYVSKNYGYELKHPSDWSYGSDVMGESFGKNFVKNSDDYDCSLNINVVNTADFDSFITQEKATQKQNSVDVKTSTVINENNISIVKDESSDSIKAQGIYASYYIKNEKGKFSYQIYADIIKNIINKDGDHVAYGTVNDQNCLNIFDQILSTFKFSKTDETANWQTYKNEKYGFEIKYPQNFYTQEGNYDSNEKYRQYWIEAADSKWKDQQVHNPALIIDVIKTDLKPKEYLDKTGSSKSMLDDVDPCQAMSYCSVKDIKDIVVGVDKIPALQFYSAAVSGSDYDTIVGNNGFLIDIRAHSSGNGDFSPDIYNQILSTFKFTK